MSKLVNEINRLNKTKQNEPKDLKKFVKRITRNREIDQLKKNIKNTYTSIKKSVEDKKREKKEQQALVSYCQNSYNEFLKMADKAKDKFGVESFDTHLGPGTIIFTHGYGPFVKTPISNGPNAHSQSYLYEGFAKDESGLYKYYNLEIEKAEYPHSPDQIFTIVKGFSLDPNGTSLELINESLDSQNHFVEDYYTLMEKSTLAAEKSKQ